MLSLRHIEVFRTVMLVRSMTVAADTLFVTQSAVSKIIRELEEDVGFVLFERRHSGLVPSAEAKSLFVEVERVFLGLDKVSRAAERIRSRREGQLRLVVMPSLSSHFIQGVIRSFSAECPGVGVSLFTYNSPEVIELAASSQFDLGYAMTPIDRDRGVDCDVMTADCVCVLPPGHPLAAKSRIDVADFDGQAFVALAANNSTRLKIDAIFRSANVAPSARFEASWSAGVMGFVAQGMGLAILDPFSAQTAPLSGCEVRPLTRPIDFSFAEIKASHNAPNELTEIFGRHFRTALRALVY
ncbi:Octopine catabolism/uptake operon regulatory protein OccR [Achromobacter deleyi]|uniref:Octopine catabolism/uptake operon regulatory protein OccR n=1 Tax=Achromobacter deleyi TaxID=1353891 RepID=A0A6S6ZB06_9BURK|nr:LysR substrate-binding domain-containing protein [Achromobacter deleyi]CAB3664905.1 Octopine catabolism/uptake operon regulatory protein OccR [Achromobacter deleyi]CAB3823106.1 Octopine catabolism/uptake operon regulatory protein OccR [Achromobacter deleyi]CAB3834734.1 Octopine catabolism/uptake operon regulatory protein OccR [Achromobacter deleyi]CAB3926041.1 Octopine catabolism/uptake operon regulatory protein OccR [Achromobacter deleyi]